MYVFDVAPCSVQQHRRSQGNDNVLDFSYHENKPNRILFVDPKLLDVLRDNNGKKVDFEVKMKGSWLPGY